MPMSEIIQLFLALAVVIVLAKAFGLLSTRIKQPAILGQLIAGVLIGPSLIDLFHQAAIFPNGPEIEHALFEFAEIGVLLLMFSAGLEIDLKGMRKVGAVAVTAGLLGVLAPLLLLTPVALAFNVPFPVALFTGLILAATSVSISAQVMVELGVLGSREGLALLGAAVVDDVLVVLLISLFIAINPGGVAAVAESRSVVEVLLRVTVYLVAAITLGWVFLPRVARRISTLPISEGALTTAVVAALVFGVAADFLGGMAAITGAFIAGVCLGRAGDQIKHEIETGLHRLNYAFFVPIFFVSIGLQTNLRLLGASILPFALLLTAVAIVSKIAGAGLGGLLTGFDRRSALRLGVGMVSRGEVGLIVAALGVANGIIGEELFAAIVFVVLVTTVITPPLVHWAFAEPKPSESAAS